MEITPPRLLLIGGTGFIGSHILEQAISKGFHVTNLSKSRSVLESGIESYSVDIADKKNLCRILKNKNFDYVINAGGYINHNTCLSSGQEILNTHFQGLTNLIECISTSKIKTFIQLGSSDEYGDNDAPQKEIFRERPFSLYSLSKTLSTFYLQNLFNSFSFPVVILRPFLVYGPSQNLDRFLPQIINSCLKNEEFEVSPGDQIRDFCYIDDFVNAVFMSLENQKAYGKIINVASGSPVSIKQIITQVVKIVGSGCAKFGALNYRKGENMELYADISKANKILNWSPKVSLEEGLSKTVEWYKERDD